MPNRVNITFETKLLITLVVIYALIGSISFGYSQPDNKENQGNTSIPGAHGLRVPR